jgi:hypothetical protein
LGLLVRAEVAEVGAEDPHLGLADARHQGEPSDVLGGVEHGAQKREVVGDRLLVQVRALHDEPIDLGNPDLVEHEGTERRAEVSADDVLPSWLPLRFWLARLSIQ